MEIDKSNNTASLAAFGADLALGRLNFTQQGSQIELHAVVQNLGPAQSPASQLALYQTAVTCTLLASQPLPALSAGETITLSLAANLSALPAGAYSLLAAVNPEQADFIERIGDNNQYAFSLRLGPDLALAPEKLWTTPLAGAQVQVMAAVQNLGSAVAPPSVLGFYRGTGLAEGSLAYTTTVPALAAGETLTVTAVITGPLRCGLAVLADATQQVPEVTHANNLAAIQPAGGICLAETIYLPLVMRAGIGAASIALATGSGYTAITGSDGNYSISGLPAGSYLLAASQSGRTFAPASRSVTIPPDKSGQNFTRQGGAPPPTGDMVLVPAGTFQMGCDPSRNGGYTCSQQELPLHTVYLDAYRIDRTEVTNAQYAQCVVARECTPPFFGSSWSHSYYYGTPTYASYPMINVSWSQSHAYCSWAGKRLPSEAEWEKAARGTSDTRAYPWGAAAPNCSLANLFITSYCVGDASAVGSYPAGASPYGALDMAGNVSEYVNDWWDSSYYSVSPGSNPPGPATGSYRVVRGGSWNDSSIEIRVAFRDYYNLSDHYDQFFWVGFRCAGAP